MNPRIASIENLIAQDPGGRNIFGLLIADQLRLAAQSLRLAKRVGIVSGFYVPAAAAGETDGPPGAKLLGQALTQLGIKVDYLTDEWNAPLFRALGLEPITDGIMSGEEFVALRAEGRIIPTRLIERRSPFVGGPLERGGEQLLGAFPSVGFRRHDPDLPLPSTGRGR